MIILLRRCDSGDIVEPKVKIERIQTVVHDTIFDTIPQYVPQWVYRKPDTVVETADVDTAAILEDYFATYTYSDTIDRDSLTIYIDDEISKNRIASRNVKYEMIHPTKTITITKETIKNEWEFYTGPTLAMSKKGFRFVGVEGILRSKKNTAFKVNVGLNNEMNFQAGFGLHWKIFGK